MDYDLVSCDALLHAHARSAGLDICGHKYQALVLPYAEALPLRVLKKISELVRAHVKVICVRCLPSHTSEGDDVVDLRSAGIHTVALEELVSYMRQLGVGDMVLTNPAPYLRSRHVRLTTAAHIISLTKARHQ